MKLLKIKFVFIILIFKAVTANNIVDNYIEDSDSFNAESDGFNFDSDGFDAVSDDFDDDSILGAFDRINGSFTSEREKIELQGNCDSCGIAFTDQESGRVINGSPVTPLFKYPWIVTLMFDNTYRCGGTLISANFVLTAAHCLVDSRNSQHPLCRGDKMHKNCYVSPESLKVMPLATESGSSGFLDVSRVIPHPEHIQRNLMHDVALLQLASPVRCSAYTLPVCLPPRDFHEIGTTLITAGFGQNTPEGQDGPQMLTEGEVQEIDPRHCVRPDQPSDNFENIICLSGIETGISSCYGDSGSSAFGRYGSKYYAVGIVSYGTSTECSGANPVAYTRIYAHLTFIKRYVKDLPL